MATTYESVGDLADALRRAPTAHGKHEELAGQEDPDWPDWYALYLVREHAGARRLLILGGGPVGVEIAQAGRRFGGDVAVIDRSTHVLAREPAPLGEALSEVLPVRA